MNALPHPEHIRELVLQTFAEFRGQALSGPAMIETILVRQGHYFGRAYRAGGLLAMLSVESGTLSFYTSDGQLLRSLALTGESPASQPQRRAA